MTIFHFKAILLKREKDLLTYRFFPDHVASSDISGIFRISIDSWEYEIIASSDVKKQKMNTSDKHCVIGLVSKLKKIVLTDGKEIPKVFYRIS